MGAAGAPTDKQPIRVHREPPAASHPKGSEKKSFFRRPGIIVARHRPLIVAILYATATVMFHLLTHQSTDDAFVDVHVVSVAPKIAGRVSMVHVADNQPVKKGDVLIDIDPRDFQAALAQANANLAKDKATEIQSRPKRKAGARSF